ncbi:MAG: hypothetical protein CTY15_11145 [Methylocystis sp.]|nr:MAG: hypothetical protein CTY15_11145 [Methylocystis sp.]
MMVRGNGSGFPASRDSVDEEPAERRSSEDAAALASYIADMAAELSHLAGGAQMPMLAYFLNLARVEAELNARESGGAPIARDN